MNTEQPLTISNEMIGKNMFAGIFAGQFNGEYYFVEPSVVYYHGTNQLNWYECKEIASYLPTKDELLFLYSTKEQFNANCQEDERWLHEDYWTPSELNTTTGLVVNFKDGEVYSANKKYTTFVRGIRKIKLSDFPLDTKHISR